MSSVIRKKDESQNRGNEKTKHVKFSKLLHHNDIIVTSYLKNTVFTEISQFIVIFTTETKKVKIMLMVLFQKIFKLNILFYFLLFKGTLRQI